MTMLQNRRGRQPAARRPRQGHDHARLHEGRDRGIEAPAGAGRFLGRVVRALQAAHAGAGKGRQAPPRARSSWSRWTSTSIRPFPGQMGIQSIPAVIAFVNGQPADGFLGALPESQVTAFIERITKDKIGGEAQGSAEGRRRGARRRRRRRARPSSMPQVLAEDAEQRRRRSPASRAPMSRPARSSRPSRRSRWCRKPSATMPRSRPRAPRSRSPSRRSRSARSASSSRRSPPIRSTIRRASISRSRSTPTGKRAGGGRHLIEIVKRDRKWNDDGARKQLVQFFEAWGPTDEATVAGRKRLSSILFA